MLLQSATGIKKYDDYYTKCDRTNAAPARDTGLVWMGDASASGYIWGSDKTYSFNLKGILNWLP